MLSCSIWFSAPRFWMGGCLQSRCVGRVYGADDAARHHSQTVTDRVQKLWINMRLSPILVAAGLRRGSAAAHLLALRVRFLPGARTFVSHECCVLSGRGLCVGLITLPEYSWRMWWVQWVWSRTLIRADLDPESGRSATKNDYHPPTQSLKYYSPGSTFLA